MVDYPETDDFENSLVLAQNVRLLVGDTEDDATTPDRFTQMRETTVSINYPEQRTNHGLTRIYTYGAPDIEISGTMSLSQELFAYLRTRTTRNARGQLPTYAFAVQYESIDGTDKVLRFEGKLMSKEFVKGDGQQENPTDVRIRIRVVSSDEPAATAT